MDDKDPKKKEPNTLKQNSWLVCKYTFFITSFVLFMWFMIILMSELSYKYFYQDLVKDTIRSMVKPEYLLETKPFSLIDPEKK